MPKIERNIQAIVFFIISTIVLSLGLYDNQWHAATTGTTQWYEEFHVIPSNAQVLSRIVKTRQDGLLSSGGLLAKMNESTYDDFLQDQPLTKFVIYESQSGFQAIVFGWVDNVLVGKLSPADRIEALEYFNAALCGIALAGIATWVLMEFGWFAAIVTLVTLCLSQWLTVFGRNLVFAFWTFYLPMIVILIFQHRERRREKYSVGTLGSWVFIGVLIKCLLSGYEVITTTLVMMLVPLIYYAVLDKWTMIQLIQRLFISGVASILGILASFAVLAWQIAIAKGGGIMVGVASILSTFGRRAYGDAVDFDPIFAESLKANPITVIFKFLDGVAFNWTTLTGEKTPIQLPSISFETLIAVFLAITAIYLMLPMSWRNRVPHREKITALIVATWFSLLAPLSWFIIFKSAAYIHTHLYNMTWHMPFVILGFALVALIVQSLVSVRFLLSK